MRRRSQPEEQPPGDLLSEMPPHLRLSGDLDESRTVGQERRLWLAAHGWTLADWLRAECSPDRMRGGTGVKGFEPARPGGAC